MKRKRLSATRIINYEKKKIISLTKEEKINYNDQQICYICKKEFDKSDKKHHKVRDHCHYTDKYRGAAHNICNLRYKVPKEIPVVFHNSSTYDYHFIIKELVKEFEGNFHCLGENTKKYITFSVPLKKKIENKNPEITYKIKFIDSFRFLSSSSLSKLVHNLSEGIHNNKRADCKSNLDYIKTKNEKLILECYNCKQRYRKKFNKGLIKRFASTYEFCNNHTTGSSSSERLNKFVLLLRKGVYPYESMDTCERFSEISLPSKEDFYSNLNMEDISDIDYRHANNVVKRFKLENLGDYHDLYIQSDTLLLADVFNNFRDMCIKNLGQNTKKYITFSVPLKKKIENKNLEITYKIKFIDSFRFMSSSLSKLVDNLSEGIHNNKRADCKSNLDYIKTKNEKLILECYNCKQRYRKKFNKELIKRFASTYEFCNNHTTGSSSSERLNKFVLLLRKGVYPYEYMDTCERFSEISLPSKEDFYSNLNMEDISDIDYRHANNVVKRFKLENLGDYHDLYVQSDTLLLADVFNNFRDM